MNRQLLVGIYIVIGAIMLYKVLIKLFTKQEDGVEKELDNILNSDKYKVKGQYDSE